MGFIFTNDLQRGKDKLIMLLVKPRQELHFYQDNYEIFNQEFIQINRLDIIYI